MAKKKPAKKKSAKGKTPSGKAKKPARKTTKKPPEKTGRQPRSQIVNQKAIEDEQVHAAYQLLLKGHRKSDVKRALETGYGIGYRTAEERISRARNILRADEGGTKQELRDDASGWYRQFVQDENLEPLVRIKARERMDKLHGLEQHEIDIGPTLDDALRAMGFLDPQDAVEQGADQVRDMSGAGNEEHDRRADTAGPAE